MKRYYIDQIGGKREQQWKTLEHNGVKFPPEYEKHNIPVVYEGKEIILNKDAEEAATFYAREIESDNVNDKVFRDNFWKDWKKLLGKDHVVKSLENVDFRKIYDYLIKKKELKKNIKVDKQAVAAANEKYMYAILDGVKQPVGNYLVEPPGIFKGRGKNPLLGRIKPRIKPSDITINIGKKSKIPELPNGQSWGKIVHDQTGLWLASWKDVLTGKTKYVRFGAKSDVIASSDNSKFDKARKLKKNISKIRKINNENMRSDNDKIRQVSTAIFFIDNFALRIGNKKSKNEADTVGVTSLRVEHVKLLPDRVIQLDFLGKDSVRYYNKLKLDKADEIVYENINAFMKDKSPSEKLFDKITSSDVNKCLQTFMKGLTAKVFRTFNSSNLFQKELDKLANTVEKLSDSDKISALIDGHTRANGKVAVLCNHQKNVGKGSNKALENLDNRIKETKKKIKELKSADKPNPKRIETHKSRLKVLVSKKKLKDEQKNISLGTSKINYIDPRITVSFMKKYNIPIDKLFNKTLQEKFKWAMDTPADYKF